MSKITGGPSEYYDFPEGMVTGNDLIEFLAEKRWKEDSFALGNIFKALIRWGDKQGTSTVYDLRKIVYYACRMIMKYEGEDAVHQTIQEIMDDKQFNRKRK